MVMGVSARALDGVYGRSAVGVRARVERSGDSGWVPVAHGETDVSGLFAGWADDRLERGAHRIVFDIDSYFSRLGVTAAYSEVVIAFQIRSRSDACQIQVVLAPSSFSMHFETHG
jgi:5-hydroxyisourate hydrolase